MEFKSLQDGTFTMGEGDEAHEVTLTQTFKLGVHEVTQFQYEQVMGTNPSVFMGSDIPVDKVCGNDAIAPCRRLSALPAQKTPENVYHLPTEDQVEYARRAGTTTRFSSRDDESGFVKHAWNDESSDNTTHGVGGKQRNAWGLYDIHGNACEWRQNWDGDYPRGCVTDPSRPASGSFRVLRGSGWHDIADECRSAMGSRVIQSTRFSHCRFRVSLSSPAMQPKPRQVRGAKDASTTDQGRSADLHFPCPVTILSRQATADENTSHLGIILWTRINLEPNT